MSIAQKNSKRFFPTYILLGLNIGVYVVTSIISGDFLFTSEPVLVTFGQVNLLVAEGAYWQLFTAMLVHVSIVHLLGNMLFLLVFGLRAEEVFSVWEYLLVYFASGLTGNVLTLLLLNPFTVSAGASGAIFGMFGASVIYFRRALTQSIMGALIYAFILLLISTGPQVNIFAHLGGLVAGLVIGYAVAATRKFRTTYAYQYSYAS